MMLLFLEVLALVSWWCRGGEEGRLVLRRSVVVALVKSLQLSWGSE